MSERKPHTLWAAMAALGVWPAITWIRRRVSQAPGGPPAPVENAGGEVALRIEDSSWIIVADLAGAPAGGAWLLLKGVSYEAVAHCASEGPLEFRVPAGEAGLYRFWIAASRARRETASSLARRTGKAVIAGEFRIPLGGGSEPGG